MARKYPLWRGGKHRQGPRARLGAAFAGLLRLWYRAVLASARGEAAEGGGLQAPAANARTRLPAYAVQLGPPEQRLGEPSRGLVHELPLEAGRSRRRLEEPPRASTIRRRRGEDAVDRLDLARVDHPLAVVAVLERAPRREDEAEVVAEPGVRPVERLQARGAGGRDHARERVVGGAGADRQHRHAERGGEIGRPEDERLEAVRRRRRSARPRRARAPSRSGPRGRSRPGADSAAADTSSGDSTLGSTTTSGSASAAARRSSSHHCVERPLTRSAVVRPSGPRPSAATASPRACSLSSAATASSRSTITSSAASDGAFASIRSLEAGTVRQERRARAGTRER